MELFTVHSSGFHIGATEFKFSASNDIKQLKLANQIELVCHCKTQNDKCGCCLALSAQRTLLHCLHK